MDAMLEFVELAKLNLPTKPPLPAWPRISWSPLVSTVMIGLVIEESLTWKPADVWLLTFSVPVQVKLAVWSMPRALEASVRPKPVRSVKTSPLTVKFLPVVIVRPLVAVVNADNDIPPLPPLTVVRDVPLVEPSVVEWSVALLPIPQVPVPH